ncbi:MAG: V-type ATP synthase subunit I [Phascolarctobacterium sp.]|nr:V-type ATP synthase subunit I [Candidatus Phascolarctobacterium equi]
MLIPMKKATLFALKEDRDALLLELQKHGDLMLISEGEKKPLDGAAEISDKLQQTKDALKFVDLHAPKKSLFAAKPTVAYDRFLKEIQEGEDLTKQLSGLSEQIASKRNEAATMLSQVAALNAWMDMDIPLEDLKPTENTTYFAGYMENAQVAAFTDEVAPLNAEVISFAEAPEGRALLIFSHKDSAAQVKHFLKAHDFLDVVFPKRTGLVKEIAVDLTRAAQQNNVDADNLEKEAKALSDRQGELELYYDQLATKEERMAQGGTETDKTFYLEGWCRADRAEAVKKAVASITDAYDINFFDPAEGEVPPSVMENNALVRPYESVVELYSRPLPGTMDPNLFMAPFHFIFFGMMLSDAGYGLVLTIALYIIMKVLKPKDFVGKLTMVVLLGSISTVIWGAAFGGWFGLEWKPLLFVPMKEPLKMLALCFGLGGLHLIVGICLKLYSDLKNGDIIGAIADEAAWLVIFAGLAMMAVVPGEIGKYTALFGSAIIVLFGGRAKKGIFSRLMSGVLSLYNISGYLSDLLSYSRLFALGLATGVIAMVINTIAGMLAGAGPVGIVAAVLVLVGGHVFNIIINILGAFVHSSRLQYIEFFGKFFQAGGRAFVPLALRTKYTDVTN